jgi:hypothetical protein
VESHWHRALFLAPGQSFSIDRESCKYVETM